MTSCFSRKRRHSKGSRFTLGVWGLRVCSLDVAFTSATVRNRPCEARMAVPMASSVKDVTFGGFKCRVASFCVAGVAGVAGMALCDIPTCFITCPKSFCVAGAILLRRFQTMSCIFRGRRTALRRPPSSFRVASAALLTCRVAHFCESHCQGCVKRWQRANSVAGVARCEMWWKMDGGLARNIDFKLILSFMRKLVGKPWFWSYKALKIEEDSKETLVLRLHHVSSRFCGFLLPSPCLWGKPQNLSFSMVSKPVVITFCVASVALRDILTCLLKCVESRYLWQAQHFGDVHRHFTWHVCCCVFCANRIAALPRLRQVVTTCKSRGRRGMLWHAMTLHTLQSTLYTLHSTLYTVHSTLYTPHFTLHTLHSTLYTPHFTLYTLHSTLYTSHSTLRTLHSTLYTLHSTLRTPQSPLLTLHTTFPTQHSTFFTPHTLHSTLFRIPQSTAHWYGNRETCTRLFKALVSQRCFTWLHSGSWAASCFAVWKVKFQQGFDMGFVWKLGSLVLRLVNH